MKVPNDPLQAAILNHTYPAWLLRYPILIHLLYGWNWLFSLRVRKVSKRLHGDVSLLSPDSYVLDAGCGEGQYLIPLSRRYPQLQFVGIDKHENHISFLQAYQSYKHISNLSLVRGELETADAGKSVYKLAWIVGVLQYIENDSRVLHNLFDALLPEGVLHVYVPVNGYTLLPLYKRLQAQGVHYEISQDRKRIYSASKVLQKLTEAGFEIEQKEFTYAYPGILGHEVYSLCVFYLGSGNILLQMVSLLGLVLLSPLILALLSLDTLVIKQRDMGNGLWIKARKPVP